MPRPLEICIEDLALSDVDRHVRCVALPGGEPGLALDRRGTVRWMPEGPVEGLLGLWVSADDRLVLLRGAEIGPVTVERAGRRVVAPAGKPVILMDGDLLHVAGRQLRVHVHGETDQIHEPQPLHGMGRLVRATAAALALGAMVGGSTTGEARQNVGSPPPIEVRERPPSPVEPRLAVDCTITSMKAGKVLQIHATCRKSSGIVVGTFGHIIDPKTSAPMSGGGVRVKSVNGTAVVGEALQLKKPVKATTLRLMVSL